MKKNNENVNATCKKASSVKKATGTKEWSTHSVNIQIGCSNNCKYCYAAAMSIRFGRSTPETWSKPSICQKAMDKTYRKVDGTIMFPTSHDITPDNIDQCIVVMKKMLEAGNKLLIVSKPHLPCADAMCRQLGDYKEQMLFRFTMGSADEKVIRYWEPGAPSFAERIESLKLAFACGFQTSVSSEPMLDGRIDRVIEAARKYVTDAIWIGRPNRLNSAIAMTCRGDSEAKVRAGKLISLIDDKYVRALHGQYKNDPMIKWKDSIKKVVGIPRLEVAGLDM